MSINNELMLKHCPKVSYAIAKDLEKLINQESSESSFVSDNEAFQNSCNLYIKAVTNHVDIENFPLDDYNELSDYKIAQITIGCVMNHIDFDKNDIGGMGFCDAYHTSYNNDNIKEFLDVAGESSEDFSSSLNSDL